MPSPGQILTIAAVSLVTIGLAFRIKPAREVVLGIKSDPAKGGALYM